MKRMKRIVEYSTLLDASFQEESETEQLLLALKISADEGRRWSKYE